MSRAGGIRTLEGTASRTSNQRGCPQPRWCPLHDDTSAGGVELTQEGATHIQRAVEVCGAHAPTGRHFERGGGSLATVQCSTANPKTSLVVGETGSPLCELVQPDADGWPQSTLRPRPESSKRALSVLRTPQHTDVSETRHRAGGVLRTPRGSSLRWPEGRRSAKGTAPGATPQGDRLGSQKASIAAGSRLKFQPG